MKLTPKQSALLQLIWNGGALKEFQSDARKLRRRLAARLGVQCNNVLIVRRALELRLIALSNPTTTHNPHLT